MKRGQQRMDVAPPPVAIAVTKTSLARSKRVDTEAIFDIIRTRISTLQYAPGAALREQDLAAEFKVSRTPIRQVLQRLELAGLVQPVVGYGTVVTSIDLEAMRDVLQFRLQLALMLEHFLDLSSADAVVKRLRSLDARMASLTSEGEGFAFSEIAHETRLTIMGTIANPYVAKTWIDTYYLASRLWFSCYVDAKEDFKAIHMEETRALIRSYSRRDPKLVAETLHRYMKRWLTVMWRTLRID